MKVADEFDLNIKIFIVYATYNMRESNKSKWMKMT